MNIYWQKSYDKQMAPGCYSFVKVLLWKFHIHFYVRKSHLLFNKNPYFKMGQIIHMANITFPVVVNKNIYTSMIYQVYKAVYWGVCVR